MELAIEAQDLVKRSGAATALDGGEPVLLNATRTRHHRTVLVRHDNHEADKAA